MFDCYTTEKIEFNPVTHLRNNRRQFIIDDKVVVTQDRIQYKHPKYEYWETLDTHQETVNVKDEAELWSNYGLKVKT